MPRAHLFCQYGRVRTRVMLTLLLLCTLAPIVGVSIQLLALKGDDMRDVYCPICGEPWENDTLHDYAEEYGTTYRDVYRAFFSDGCGVAFDKWGVTCERPEGGSTRALFSSMLADILGDDVDGIISEMQDAEAFGFLND